MTKTERLAVAAVFREAKKHLAHDGRLGKWPYICYAINAVAGDRPTKAHTAARKVVMDRLGGRASMLPWLEDQGIPRQEITINRLQAHRHAWLDQLIAEFSS